jgi:UDP-glucose:(heptosyl)LPS alpha-1,3-glucosyltransferase
MNESTTPKRLRIAVLNRNFLSTGGGAERYSIAVVEQLAARHEIHVFAQHIGHVWPGVTYHQVPRFLERPRWLNQLWYAIATWWLTRKQFDVVHSHENTWVGNVHTLHVPPVKHNLFHGKSGMAWVLKWLTTLLSPRLLVYLWLEARRLSLRQAKLIVLASDSLKTQTVAAYPQCASAVQVITPGVTKVIGAATPDQRQVARASLGLPALGHCVLMVGHDYRKKGLPSLLRAMVDLPDDYYLVVVGKTNQLNEFKRSVINMGLVRRVFFLGAITAMDEVYSAADCLVHPTLEDTFAMVVLEAMSHGLPVVVSSKNYCGISESLTEGVNALLLADPRDVAALVSSIQRVFETPDLRDTLISNGLVFAKDHLWSSLSESYDAAYHQVAASIA